MRNISLKIQTQLNLYFIKDIKIFLSFIRIHYLRAKNTVDHVQQDYFIKRRTMKTLFKLFLSSLLIALVFSSCKTETQTSNSNAGVDTSKLKGQSGVVDNESERNILQIAISSPDHSTLVAGVQATRGEKD